MTEKYSFKKMIVYQKSMRLVVLVYKLFKLLPSEEKFGIRSQMSRAVVSIPSNIAEGSRRRGLQEKKQFFRIAFGSASELETQIDICIALSFFTESQASEVRNTLDEIQKMLNALAY